MLGVGEVRFAHTQADLGFNAMFIQGHDNPFFGLGNIYKWCLTSLLTPLTSYGPIWIVGPYGNGSTEL